MVQRLNREVRDAPVNLFVYGTLVRPGRLEKVLGRQIETERIRATLRGYERRTIPDYPYPALVEREGALTPGLLVLDLTPEDFVLLDAYEEVAEGHYQRITVFPEAEGCGPTVAVIQAEAYIAGPALASRYWGAESD